MKSKISVVALLAALLSFGSIGTLLAGTMGTLSGTAAGATTSLPLGGVTIAALTPLPRSGDVHALSTTVGRRAAFESGDPGTLSAKPALAGANGLVAATTSNLPTGGG